MGGKTQEQFNLIKIVLSHFNEIKNKYDLDVVNEWDGE